jgi:dTDP-4-dehydrorhamnose reductase
VRLLVTGRDGQLATSLLERGVLRDGVEVVTLGRPQLDLEAPETIRPAIEGAGADVVVNAAAYTAVDAAEDEPERAFRVNAEAAGELAAAARDSGARFIQISTDYVFDGAGEGYYDEEAPPRPLGVYGRSKLLGEQRVRQADPSAAIVRTSWVYSPFGRNFVKTMLGLARANDVVRVVADQRGCPSSALDLAEGLLTMALALARGPDDFPGSTFHLTGHGEASWAGFAELIFEEARRHHLPSARVEPIQTSQWPTRAERPKNSRLQSDRFARDFGYCAPAWQESAAAVVARLAQSPGGF